MYKSQEHGLSSSKILTNFWSSLITRSGLNKYLKRCPKVQRSANEDITVPGHLQAMHDKEWLRVIKSISCFTTTGG